MEVDWPSLVAGGVVTVAAALVLRRISEHDRRLDNANAIADLAQSVSDGVDSSESAQGALADLAQTNDKVKAAMEMEAV
jgi:purine nucleoside permease